MIIVRMNFIGQRSTRAPRSRPARCCAKDSTVTETMIRRASSDELALVTTPGAIMVRLLDAEQAICQQAPAHHRAGIKAGQDPVPLPSGDAQCHRAHCRVQADCNSVTMLYQRPDRRFAKRKFLDRGLCCVARRGRSCERRRVCRHRGRGLCLSLGGLLRSALSRAGYRADRAACPSSRETVPQQVLRNWSACSSRYSVCLPFISSGVHQERRPVRRHW